MTQNGSVVKILDNGQAEISIHRGTACSGSCGSCESCVYDTKMIIRAENLIHAAVGDRVVVTGKNSDIVGAAFLIYMLPLAMFFVVYAIAYSLALAQGISILLSFAGLAAGAAAAVLIGRRKKELRYEVTSFIR